MNHNFKDITGQRFNRLTVLKYVGNDRNGLAVWRTECECGTIVNVRGADLRSGHSKSCGCAKIVHGHTRHRQQSPEFVSWRDMRNRCEDPDAANYRYYGGRANPVRVCKRWRESFQAFLADVGARPPGTTLGRRNDSGDYAPGNAWWQTRDEQREARKHRQHVSQKTALPTKKLPTSIVAASAQAVA